MISMIYDTKEWYFVMKSTTQKAYHGVGAWWMLTAFLDGSPHTGLRFRLELCKQISWEVPHHHWSLQSIFTVPDAYLLSLLPTTASISFFLLASYSLSALSQLNFPEPQLLHGEQGKDSLTKVMSCASLVLRNRSNLHGVIVSLSWHQFIQPTLLVL